MQRVGKVAYWAAFPLTVTLVVAGLTPVSPALVVVLRVSAGVWILCWILGLVAPANRRLWLALLLIPALPLLYVASAYPGCEKDEDLCVTTHWSPWWTTLK